MMALGLALTVAATPARAAVVSTAALPVEFQDKAACILVNVGRKPVRVRSIEIIGVFGDTFAAAGEFDLAPRRTRSIFVAGRQHGFGNDPMFCQAEVAGGAKQVRLTVCAGEDGGRCGTLTD
jgi:hypothetical protein